jgi:hypothetical protein
MDTSWWLALAAVVLLALVAALVDGWGRRPPGRLDRRRPAVRPRPTEIWWASVPFEDRPGAKDERSGVIPLPPGAVSDAQGRASFLETDELREVPVRDFRRKAGVVDPVLWDQVRHLAG